MLSLSRAKYVYDFIMFINWIIFLLVYKQGAVLYNTSYPELNYLWYGIFFVGLITLLLPKVITYSDGSLYGFIRNFINKWIKHSLFLHGMVIIFIMTYKGF